MSRSDSERSISPVAATIVVVAIGVVIPYFGFGLVNVGFYAFSRDEYLLGIVALVFGAALVIGPAVVLVSQLRAMARNRDQDRDGRPGDRD